MSDPRGLDVALDLLARIASGDAGARAEPTGADESIDALIVGLTMLAEEIDDERSRRAEAEALLADERDAYERSPGLACSVDVATLRIVKSNETLHRLLGKSASELLGMPLPAIIAPRQREQAEAALRDVASGRARSLPELALQAPDGERLVSATLSLTHLPAPRLRVVWSDVTNERRLEAQLIQAQKMQAIGRLSGGVAHDFNNLLGIIMTSLSFLREGGVDSPTFAEDLGMIDDAARRGADLTAQLLAFSRQQVAQPRRVDLVQLLRDVERMLSRLIGEGVTLSLDLPSNPSYVLADPSQLVQVLMNLTVNARDALRGSGHVLLELEDVQLDESYSATHLDIAAGRYALISVSDDGPGMTREVLAQAFEPFFTTKPPGEGTGLGLSVCYGIVRQAGGHIVLYSELGQGTTVKVYLPSNDRETAAPSGGDDPGVGAASDELVLLVEDEAVLRKLTTRVLERAGYRVLVAANGDEAIELMRTRGPVDVVVTDVIMPKLGGRALVDQLLRDGKTRAALYLSGYTANSIVHHGVLDDGVNFLAKPFTTDQLLRALRRALDGK
jgi:two-component system, cell cycle sensor histidine kinase and response regulator CckA